MGLIQLKINNSIQELKTFDALSISKMNWWLLKHYNLYKYCKKNWNNDSCFDELPSSHTLSSKENKFIDFYQTLDEISQIHKLNKVCRKELSKYSKFKDEKQLVNSWLKRNEEIYNDLFFDFWLDNKIIDNQILLYLPHYNQFEIKIYKFEFKDVIEFLDLYSQVESLA